MNNAFDKIKDLLYDYIDYILILIVVLLIGAIIGWRLDLLFGEKNESEETNNNVNVEEPLETDDEKTPEEDTTEDANDNKEQDEEKDDENEKDSSSEKSSLEGSDSIQTNEDIVVEIPEGSLPPETAQLLVDHGIISDKTEFLNRAADLGLDVKLRSGTFTFNKSSSLDNIIKILANQSISGGQADGKITVEIPQGSLPPETAQLLVAHGVISDKTEFLTRAGELGLDVKLRSGRYTFDKNSSLDSIIKKLANIK